MIVTEKIMTTNIIGNFVADKIVFGVEVLAHHPEELSLYMGNYGNLPTFIWFFGLDLEIGRLGIFRVSIKFFWICPGFEQMKGVGRLVLEIEPLSVGATSSQLLTKE